MRHDQYSQRWSDYLANVVGGWPGGSQRAQLEAEAAQSPELDPRAQLAEWQAQYPGLQAEEVFPDRFGLTAEGRFRDGLEFDPAPQPPAWFTAPFPGATRGLGGAEGGGSVRGERARKSSSASRSSRKPVPARKRGSNAAFIGLRARLATLPPAEAVTEALRFAQENRETLSEAGLPLANLAFGEALRYARATGPSEALWEAIPGQVLRAPSPLIAGFAGSIGGDSPARTPRCRPASRPGARSGTPA